MDICTQEHHYLSHAEPVAIQALGSLVEGQRRSRLATLWRAARREFDARGYGLVLREKLASKCCDRGCWLLARGGERAYSPGSSASDTSAGVAYWGTMDPEYRDRDNLGFAAHGRTPYEAGLMNLRAFLKHGGIAVYEPSSEPPLLPPAMTFSRGRTRRQSYTSVWPSRA
ncbi:hypothetical protein B0H11DRAFT_2272493 [Mycena galericulata]|nr:hypothetical protein B0H11DRAFT_2272493 [Mycena galericulata]